MPRLLPLAGWFLLALLGACARPQLAVPAFLLPQGAERPLEVVLVSPQGERAGVEPVREVQWVFNQPMVPLGFQPDGEGEARPPARIDPQPPGRWRWRGTATLVFEPARPLPASTRFTLTVPAGARAWSGQVLAEAHRQELITPRPALVASLPRQGEASLRGQGPLFLWFNQAMDPSRAAPHVKLVVGGDQVPARLRRLTGEELAALQAQELVTSAGPARPGPEARDRLLALEPVRPLARGSACEVRLLAGLRGAEGPEALLETARVPFRTMPAFRLEGLTSEGGWRPDSPLVLSFTNPVKPADLVRGLSFDPPVELPGWLKEEEGAQTVFYLDLPLKPRATYRARLAAGLRNELGEALGREATSPFKTGDFAPTLLLPEGLGVLEAGPAPTLPVGLRNVPEVRVEMAPLTPAEVAGLLDRGIWEGPGLRPAQGVGLERRWRPGVPLNQRAELPLELGPLLKGGRFGLVYLRLTAPGSEGPLERRLLTQVTDLGLSAKFGPEQTLVWVTSLSGGRPVAGATVEIRDRAGALLHAARSDARGLAQVPGWAALGLRPASPWEPPRQLVFARLGEDMAFLEPQGSMGISPWDFDLDFAWTQAARSYRAHLFTERGLYRAGERVHLKGVLRRWRQGAWRLPEEVRALEATLTDPRGRVRASGQVEVSGWGSFSQSLPLPADAPTGEYTLSYRLPAPLRSGSGLEGEAFSTGFRVEAYRPALFEVAVRTREGARVQGEELTAEVQARFLSGAPMGGDPVSWSARVQPWRFEPQGYPGYRFGPLPVMSVEEGEDPDRVLARGEGALDPRGVHPVQLSLQGFTEQGPAQVVLEGTVSSASRQKISGRVVVPVLPASVVAGVKVPGRLLAAGDPARVELVSLDPSGAPAPGQRIQVELLRRDWLSVRKAGVGGRYEWVSEPRDTPISRAEASTTAAGAAVELRTPRTGYYVVRARLVDGQGRASLAEDSFYAWGGDYAAWAREDGDRIELVADRPLHAPGDIARILVKSPYERATALVTVEREEVFHRFVTEVVGSADTIEVPLDSGCLPNVFVSVLLVQGRVAGSGFGPDGFDLGKPSFKLGYLELPVDPGEKRLNVEVATDQASYEPGGRVRVRLQVRDARGRGLPAEICLAAVDEGVLSLSGATTPDPFDTFHGARPLSVRTAESRLEVIGQRAYGVKGDEAGGGGGLVGDYRQDFVTTPFWSPRLLTDAAGRAEASFQLPENAGAFRIMAVAQSRGSEFGAGELRVRSSKPLQLEASAPRFARSGDRFKAGVLVLRSGGGSGPVKVQARALGVRLTGPAEQTVPVPEGASREVLFEFEALGAGPAEIGFQASAGARQDGLKIRLPIAPATASRPLVQAVSGSIEAGEVVEGLRIPAGSAPGSVTLEASLSSSILAGLPGAIQALERSPYDCLEQRLSRLVPLLWSPAMARRLGGEGLGISEVDRRARLQASVDRLAGHQTEAGGFASWPGGARISEYLSAASMITLHEATRRGIRVDGEVLQRGRDYLGEAVKAPRFDTPYTEQEAWTVRNLLLHALALHGGRDPGLLHRQASDLAGRPLDGLCHLLRAARAGGGAPALQAALTREITGRLRLEGQVGWFESPGQAAGSGWTYASPLRDTALALETLLEGGQVPEAGRVARWLMEGRAGGAWGSTQEAGAALSALARYAQSQEASPVDLQAAVRIGAREILAGAFRGSEAPSQTRRVPLGEPGQGSIPCRITRRGEGRLYYDLRLEAMPMEDPPARDRGFSLFRVVQPAEGGGPVGGPLEAGRTYRVTLSVLTPAERRFVVVEDPLAAGWEVVQTGFAVESAAMQRLLDRARPRPGGASTFEHWEVEDARVLLFADRLRAGEHTFSYLVRPTHPGRLRHPSARVEEMYHPETFGSSEGATVEVR